MFENKFIYTIILWLILFIIYLVLPQVIIFFVNAFIAGAGFMILSIAIIDYIYDL